MTTTALQTLPVFPKPEPVAHGPHPSQKIINISNAILAAGTLAGAWCIANEYSRSFKSSLPLALGALVGVHLNQSFRHADTFRDVVAHTVQGLAQNAFLMLLSTAPDPVLSMPASFLLGVRGGKAFVSALAMPYVVWVK